MSRFETTRIPLSASRRVPRLGALTARPFQTIARDEHEVVAALHAEVAGDDLAAVVFYCSPHYDLERLGSALAARFAGVTVSGCTSAGQIGPLGFQPSGLVAVGLRSSQLTATAHLITPLTDGAVQAAAAGAAVERQRAGASRAAFGLLLIDGLSMAEEQVCAALYQAMGHVPLIGGSAGDDLRFERTSVYHDGAFHSDAAVFTLFETDLPFRIFKFQHFVASDQLLVVTAADPARRIVFELDGRPAAEVYAERLGIAAGDLTAGWFSRRPLIVSFGGDDYVRAIARAGTDGSLTFFCAIEEGLILSMATATDPAAAVERALAAAATEVSAQVVLGCDCILRRLSLEASGRIDEVAAVMQRHRVIGFSTYGEQYNAIHLSHAFTGIALGG